MFVCLCCTSLGVFGARVIGILNKISLVWNVVGFLVVTLVLLITTRGDYNTGKEALVDIANESGRLSWPKTLIRQVLTI